MLAQAAVVVALVACDKRVPEPSPVKPLFTPAPQAGSGSSVSSATAGSTIESVQRLPAPARIVAIGDLHGDLTATRAALRVAGAIDDKDHWIGKDLMIVQTGNEIDRGDADRQIVDLFERLSDEAKASGGAVIALNGNHEVMNVQLDLRYVTDGALNDFTSVPGTTTMDPRLENVPEKAKSRAAAFVPGGPYAKKLSKRSIIAIVGDTVFLHGGIMPKHVRYGIDRMNREVSAWMDGSARDLPAIIMAEDGPIWLRRYSAAPDSEDCRMLEETLAMIPAKRMVVGHTVQRGALPRPATTMCGASTWVVPRPNNPPISHSTRLRRPASFVWICALARIQTQSWLARGSSTLTRVNYSCRADTRMHWRRQNTSANSRKIHAHYDTRRNFGNGNESCPRGALLRFGGPYGKPARAKPSRMASCANAT